MKINLWSANLLAIHLHPVRNESYTASLFILKPSLAQEQVWTIYAVQIDVFICNQTAVLFQLSSGNPVYENYYRQVSVNFPLKRS